MFPVVPDDETRTESENVSPPRTEAEMVPVSGEPYVKAPAADMFTVPEPAPAYVEPVAPAPATEATFTHYVHLADGRVLKADLSAITEHIGNRYYEDRNTDSEKSTQIIGVYPR